MDDIAITRIMPNSLEAEQSVICDWFNVNGQAGDYQCQRNSFGRRLLSQTVWNYVSGHG